MTRSCTSNRPSLEALEPRLLLDGSVTVVFGDGNLYVTGDAADNAIVIEGLDNGGYRIVGMPTAGGADTLVNGHAYQEVGPVSLRLEVDLGGGDDTLNIGSLKALDTTINNIIRYEGNTGVNTLNIGRIDHEGSLWYAGQVTSHATVEFDNTIYGVGNVFIAGATLSGFDAHLGYGEGDRSVVIADLWYGLTYHPPSDIHDVASNMGTNLTIVNPLGPLDAYVADTNAATVDILSSGGDDDIVLRGVRFNGTRIMTSDGDDLIDFASSEYRGNTIYDGLTVNTGWHTDSIWMSDTYVSGGTVLDLERGGVRHDGQTVEISAFGGCELSDLSILGENLWVNFNGIAGTNETELHGPLDIRSMAGLGEDRIVMLNVRAHGGGWVRLDGGNDAVSIRESRFGDDMEFDLGLGNDTFLVGQTMTDLLPGDATRFQGNTIIDMGEGADQVGITNASFSKLGFVQMGRSLGRSQRVRIASVGGTVTASDLGIAGTGRTNVFIGNMDSPEPSVEVDDILSIATGMDMSRDTVSLLNIRVGGEVGMSTGAGNDLVAIQHSEFAGPVMAHLGDGVDVLYVLACEFTGDVELYGDQMMDWFWIVDSAFDGRAVFTGGAGVDRINRSLRTRNTFALIGQPLVDVEREF
jgi:hypothetical protein